MNVMRTQKGAIELLTQAAVLMILAVAAIAGLGLSILLTVSAGETEDTIIGVKTSVDYSGTFSRLAGISALHNAIYTNGQRGGFQEGSGTLGTFAGKTYAYWKKYKADGTLDDTVRPSDPAKIPQDIYDITQKTFTNFINFPNCNLQGVQQSVCLNKGPFVRLEADASRIKGVFAAELVRSDTAPSVGAQSVVQVSSIEDVPTTYRRLHEIGSVIAQNSESLIDARIAEAVRSVQDFDTDSQSSCAPGCSSSVRSPACNTAYNRVCKGNQINGDPQAAVNAAMSALTNELNARFASEGVTFKITVTGSVQKIKGSQSESSGSNSFHAYDKYPSGTQTVCNSGSPSGCTCGGNPSSDTPPPTC